ncbi:MAG: PmoA family protein [Planctomycetes bacterium]|nr:PmoA family protein [Planctomycetota bacterium]
MSTSGLHARNASWFSVVTFKEHAMHRRLRWFDWKEVVLAGACAGVLLAAFGGWERTASSGAMPVPAAAQGVQMTTDEHGATIKIGGQLFTRYRIDAGPKPYCWPVIGPTGLPVTRAFPMEKVEGEKQDHPHQRSWWFTHGNVNGIDFWAETPESGRIVHREFLAAESGSDAGRLKTRNDWLTPKGQKVCEDVRELIVHAEGSRALSALGSSPSARLADFSVTLKATESPVTFGDTKEGMMGFRVASSMDVDAKQGGRIVNSRGQTDELEAGKDRQKHAWGKPAEWVDYYGPVGGDVLGIAVLNHPSSFRFPTHWHVREYGLFAANPFGLHDFTGSDQVNGSHTIPKGESITFRYRIYIHKGDTEEAKVAEVYRAYAAD